MKEIKERDNKVKKKHDVETGYFEDGLPYVKYGSGSDILLSIEALSMKHEPLTGYVLKRFIKDNKYFNKDYTVYQVGRRPNLPDGYYMDEMARDYANMIRREFGKPVDVYGISTGGQIAHYLAADHPDVIRKLVLIATACRLSDEGKEIENNSAEFWKIGKYGKGFAAIIDLIYKPSLKRKFIKFLVRFIGGWMYRDIKYPNDYLVEIEADKKMNFKDRLHEIKALTLIICGELDIAYQLEDVRITAEGIPNSELILYPNQGHGLAMSKKWKEVQAQILEFLKRK